jgi:hypothetical protein
MTMAGTLNVIADVGPPSSTAETIISTIGALLGVLLGAFLTVVLDSARQRRHEHRLEQAARRLLSDELADARDVFLRIARERLVRSEHVPEPTGLWDQYRELLATRMTDLEWRKIANAVLIVRRMRGDLRPLTGTQAGLGQVHPSLVTELERTAEALGDAIALLGAVGEGPPEGRRRRVSSRLRRDEPEAGGNAGGQRISLGSPPPPAVGDHAGPT